MLNVIPGSISLIMTGKSLTAPGLRALIHQNIEWEPSAFSPQACQQDLYEPAETLSACCTKAQSKKKKNKQVLPAKCGLAGKNAKQCSFCENSMEILEKKLKQNCLITQPSTLGYILKCLKPESQKDICISKSTVALFAIAKTRKQPCVHQCLWIINCEIYM